MRFSTPARLAFVLFATSACASEEEPVAAEEDLTVTATVATAGGASTLLISDIDDTIKRTDVLDKAAAAINGLGSTNAFAGMSGLYRGWRAEGGSTKKVIYLSAAPNLLVLPGVRFLKNSLFPTNNGSITAAVVSGRRFSESAGEFKTKKLVEMYDKDAAAKALPRTVILVGDNGEQDILAYGNYINHVAQKGGDTSHIYSFIHHVYDTPDGLEIAAPHRPFVTAADLAVQLRNLGLVGDNVLNATVAEVAEALEDDNETVIPSFMNCTQFAMWPALAGTAASTDYAFVRSEVPPLCAH